MTSPATNGKVSPPRVCSNASKSPPVEMPCTKASHDFFQSGFKKTALEMSAHPDRCVQESCRWILRAAKYWQRNSISPRSFSRLTRSLLLAHLMLRNHPNPQQNEKNNHCLPGCFLHHIDRRFLCRPVLQPETHITRQHSNRRRQRRDSSCRKTASKRNGACHGLIGAKCSACTRTSPIAGALAGVG